MTISIYRCHCGTQSTSFWTDDICERCGFGLMSQTSGSAASAQPNATMQSTLTAAQKAPAKAAPIYPVGNPNHGLKSVTMISNGKVSTVTVDAMTLKPINDTRQA